MNDSQWYYLDANNQQQGPVAGAQLQALAAQSQLTPTTQVWTEGLEEWIPANQVDGLFAVAPDTNTMTSQAAYQPPNSDPLPTGGQYPSTIVTGASFPKLVALGIGAFGLIIIGSSIASSNEGNSATGGLGIALIGYIMLFILSILPYIYIYKIWHSLQPGGATITPGKAVAFLFIPIFNLYWIFLALGGLPRQWNEITSRYENTQDAPKLSIAGFICLLLVPILGIFIWSYQIIKGINFMVALSKLNATSHPDGIVGSSLNFGPTKIPTK